MLREFFFGKPRKEKTQFSKLLLIQESMLIWIITLACLILAFFCVYRGFTGSLPWLSAMVGLPWTAYGVSQAFYYNKAKAENSMGGVVYETAMAALEPEPISNKKVDIDYGI